MTSTSSIITIDLMFISKDLGNHIFVGMIALAGVWLLCQVPYNFQLTGCERAGHSLAYCKKVIS